MYLPGVSVGTAIGVAVCPPGQSGPPLAAVVIEGAVEVTLPDLRALLDVDAVDVVGDACDDGDLARRRRQPAGR
mgnify:CR=1 FL=1